VKRLLALALVLAACGTSAPEPRGLSTTEAERLALVRFTNYTAKNAKFSGSVPSPGGKLLLTGRIDFVAHLGYAAMRTDGRADLASGGLVQWNLTRMAFHGAPDAVAVDPPPAENWQLRALQKTGSELDGALRLLVNLAADRPDNAQLLQQSTARWLRSDTVDGVAVDVLEGPKQDGRPATADDARLRYWVDADGGLRRVEARLGDQQEFAVFDFHGVGEPLTVIPPIAS